MLGKLEEIQAKIYEKLQLQSRLRAFGRIISYILIGACFGGITFLYQVGNCTTYQNNVSIALILLYTILVQDQINGLIQIILICMISNKQKLTGFSKFAKYLILKENLDIFAQQRIQPVNSNENIMPGVVFSQNDISDIANDNTNLVLGNENSHNLHEISESVENLDNTKFAQSSSMPDKSLQSDEENNKNIVSK